MHVSPSWRAWPYYFIKVNGYSEEKTCPILTRDTVDAPVFRE